MRPIYSPRTPQENHDDAEQQHDQAQHGVQARAEHGHAAQGGDEDIDQVQHAQDRQDDSGAHNPAQGLYGKGYQAVAGELQHFFQGVFRLPRKALMALVLIRALFEAEPAHDPAHIAVAFRGAPERVDNLAVEQAEVAVSTGMSTSVMRAINR